MALEVEGGGVGAAAACPWTPAHVPPGGVHPHVLPQEVLALKRFWAHATPYVLFMVSLMCFRSSVHVFATKEHSF